MTEQNPTEQNPNEQESIENLLNKIQDLLRFAQKNASKEVDPTNIPSDIEKQLQFIEKEVEKFKKIGDQIVQLSGMTQDEVTTLLSGNEIPQVSPESQELIRKAEELAFQAKGLGGTAPENMLSDSRSKPKKKDISGKERRKKFKRFGANDTWKPL